MKACGYLNPPRPLSPSPLATHAGYSQPVSLAQSSTPAQLKKTFPQHVWEVLACFRSVQLAIILLSCLALSILAGVLLPQDGLVETAQIKQQFGSNYPVFRAMGLFNVYSTYWFIALEVLFFFNLLIGSFKWLRPAYIAATQVRFFDAKIIQAAPAHLALPACDSAVMRKTLKRFGYRVHENDQTLLYATKGNWSRFGPAMAHLGILLFLLASVYGTFTGFKAQKLAVPGETFTLRQVDSFIPNLPGSLWQGKVPNWVARVRDFRIEVYPEKPDTVKQYYCDLEILDPSRKRVLKRETISVNHPLSMGDVTLYQAAFNPTGKLFFRVNGEPKTLTINSNFQTRPISVVSVNALASTTEPSPLVGEGRVRGTDKLSADTSLMVFPFYVQKDPGTRANHVVLFMRDSHGFVGQKQGSMPPNLKLEEGQSGVLNGLKIIFIKPEFATGLQIKKAPEVPWIYTAFAIIGIGALMCVFSQRMLWLAPTTEPSPTKNPDPYSPLPSGEGGQKDRERGRGQVTSWVLLFKTNKGRLSFLKELERLQHALGGTSA